jgi:CDP-diglyceride synthetase
MRKLLSLIFYLAMICLGAWAVYEWLVLGGKGIVFKAGGFVAVLGLYMIWIDFISPSPEQP